VGQRPDGFKAREEERHEEVSEVDKTMHDAEGVGSGRVQRPAEGEAPPRRIVIDKRTHRVRLENETESEVTVVIEEKGRKG
jgi:hypothetical protein